MSVLPAARRVGLPGDPVMTRLRSEAEDAARKEPELAGFLIANVLNQESFEAAIAHRVASRLDHSDMPSGLIRQTFHNRFLGHLCVPDEDCDPAALPRPGPTGIPRLLAYRTKSDTMRK